MEGCHAGMQKASKLPREPCADCRRGKGPIMRRDARWRHHMMACEEGRHLAVRHAVLQRRQRWPRQHAALVAVRARHNGWEACKVPRRSSAGLPSVHGQGIAAAVAVTARTLKRVGRKTNHALLADSLL